MKGADILRTAPAKYSSEVEYASNAIANDLKSAAQVMFAGLGTRIYYTRYGSFDTHAGELRQHDQLWRSMAEAVGDFWDDVTEHGRDDDTVIFIYSEFGRRVRDNGTGTDHGDGEKTFFGETGRFNGEDVIEIIARQPATARFISRRLFQFFTADDVDDEGEEVVEAMAQSYFDSEYEIRSVMRTLFKSPYFKSEKARFARVKGPVELIVGVARLAGSYREPTLAIDSAELEASYMGQRLLSPPDVAGWNEGEEWLDGGTVMERVNFAARELADVTKPGIRAIIDRLARGNGGVLSPEALVERCLDLVGLRRQSR